MIDIAFTFFRSLDLTHLDAAWYSVSKQDFSNVGAVYVLDNNTEFSEASIDEVLHRYELPVPVIVITAKHGDTSLTQSWSVNTVVKACEEEWVFFTRADYILAFDCLARLKIEAILRTGAGEKPFVSGWCWQMAYDREAKNIDAHIDIEQYGWRERGMPALLEHPYAFRFHETNLDAGVWLTQKQWIADAGWMNEGMTSWGYQQSTFQRALVGRAGVTCVALQDYLFAHQHHAAVRDFAKASAEYNAHGGGR